MQVAQKTVPVVTKEIRSGMKSLEIGVIQGNGSRLNPLNYKAEGLGSNLGNLKYAGPRGGRSWNFVDEVTEELIALEIREAIRAAKGTPDYHISSLKKRAYIEYMKVMDSGLGRNKRGPVLSSVMYIGKPNLIKFGKNHPKKALPDNLHPILSRRLLNYETFAHINGLNPRNILGKDVAGMHSEIYAINDLLWELGPNITEEIFGDILIYNLRLIKYRDALPGTPIIRCNNCRVLTSGAKDVSKF